MQDFQVTISSTVGLSASYANSKDAHASDLSSQRNEIQRNEIQGSYIQSDWAILNGTTPEQLKRLLTRHCISTAAEISYSCALLSSYQVVYRPALLKRRAAGYLGLCPAPSSEQLEQMAQRLGNYSPTSPTELELALAAIAQRLRQI